MRTVGGVAHKPMKVTVLLEKDRFDRLDTYCEERGFKKSTLIARLIREHLDREGFTRQQELFRPARRAARDSS